MITVTWPPKDPDGVEIYGLNWFKKLQGDRIQSSNYTVTSGTVTLSSESLTGTTTSVKVTGGADGEVAELLNHIVTVNGQQFDCSVSLTIGQQ